MPIDEAIIAAARTLAAERGTTVANLPLGPLADRLEISRSTLLRRIGGRRGHLEDAVRLSGHDPGHREDVRTRALHAATLLIEQDGLGTVTMEAVARDAACSVPALHQTFGGKDGLLSALFEQHSPITVIEHLADDPPDDLEATVRAVHRGFMDRFQRSRVLAAIIADLFARPTGPSSRMFIEAAPRLLTAFEALLLPQMNAGRIRPMPVPVTVQLLLGPLVFHLALRPVFGTVGEGEDAADMFAAAFLRAVTP